MGELKRIQWCLTPLNPWAGPAEVLQEDKYRYLVPMHDPEAMAGAILRALEHPVSKELLDEAVRPFGEDAVVMAHRSALGF